MQSYSLEKILGIVYFFSNEYLSYNQNSKVKIWFLFRLICLLTLLKLILLSIVAFLLTQLGVNLTLNISIPTTGINKHLGNENVKNVNAFIKL